MKEYFSTDFKNLLYGLLEKDNKKRAKDRAFWEKEDALLREVQEDIAQRERDRKRQARGEGPSNQDFPFK